VATPKPAPSGVPSPSGTLVRSTARHGYCPFCGQARPEIAAGTLGAAETALCPGRCSAAWHALAALRLRESASDLVQTRRRGEYEAGQQHAPALSDVLLRRWRAGDWTVTPEQLLTQVS
jgi:hypothetical protein